MNNINNLHLESFNMTRDEFNKLSQQERLNLVGEKWFPLYDAEKEKAYSWTIEWSFIQDSNGKKHLTYEKLYLKPEHPIGINDKNE